MWGITKLTQFTEMKCLDDIEKQILLEKELSKLLSTASYEFPSWIMGRSINDSSSIITYIMVFLKQMPGDLTTLKKTLKNEVNIFLLSGSILYVPLQIDTDRIVDSLFAFIENLESEEKSPDSTNDHDEDSKEEENAQPPVHEEEDQEPVLVVV